MTEQLAVTGIGTYDQYIQWGGANKIDVVQPPDNDNTDGVWTNGTTDNRQSYTLAATAIPPGSTITKVTVHGRHDWYSSASTCRQFLRLGANEEYSPQHALLEEVWQNFEDDIARPGGGAWQIADLATLEAGMHTDTGTRHYCTTFYVIVTYTPPAAAGTGDMLLVL